MELIGEIINRIARGAYSVKPDAEIIAFNWDWHWYEPPPHARITEALDKRIAIAANLNLRGIKEDADGSLRRINEYALSYIGPSEACGRVHDLCKRLERKFYIQMVVGNTHECYTVPCIPVPGRVYEKAAAAKAMQPQGYFSTTFGTMPSINTRVFNKLLAQDGIPGDKQAFLKELADECFPGSRPEMVLKAWRYFAMAMSLYPFDNAFLYHGPMNYALAYKQAPGPVQGAPMNDSWLDQPRGDDLDPTCKAYGTEVVIERFDEMARLFKAGLRHYRRGLARAAGARRDPELRYAAIIPLIFASVANIYRIHLLKKKWRATHITAFKRILRAERKLCVQALPIVEKDEHLGFNVDAQFRMFSAPLIKEKIAHIDRMLGRPDAGAC